MWHSFLKILHSFQKKADRMGDKVLTIVQLTRVRHCFTFFWKYDENCYVPMMSSFSSEAEVQSISTGPPFSTTCKSEKQHKSLFRSRCEWNGLILCWESNYKPVPRLKTRKGWFKKRWRRQPDFEALWARNEAGACKGICNTDTCKEIPLLMLLEQRLSPSFMKLYKLTFVTNACWMS